MRAHQHAAGAKRGQDTEALARSRGGFSTKVHTLLDALGYPYRFILTPGQASDHPQSEPLLAGIAYSFGIADKGYDADWVVEMIENQGATAVIPSKGNRKIQREIDRHLYKERNIVERCFNRLKQFRRIATRFEKTARNYLAMLTVAAIVLWLR